MRVQGRRPQDLGERPRELMGADALVVPEALCVDAETAQRSGDRNQAHDRAVQTHAGKGTQRSLASGCNTSGGVNVRRVRPRISPEASKHSAPAVRKATR